MIRVFINPVVNLLVPSIGGIDRVVEAQYKYLKEYDVIIASGSDDADVITNHGTLREERPGVPMVAHCHGLYWDDYEWPSWTERANAEVIETIRRSNAVTVPSQWVADALTRGMLVAPEVVYHGVDTQEWTPGENAGFILWNKGREDSISNPKDMQELARRMPNIPFISTFGIPTSNVRVTGPIGYNMMKGIVQRAGLFLATVRETFGITTVEALSCGVPVVGWDYAGQREIIRNGDTGYLVPFGDYDALMEAINKAFSERDRLSTNARQDAIDNWQWHTRIKQYADLYKRVHEEYHTERPLVSIIITTHNLSKYLPACIHSLREQTVQGWEAIVVDDYSMDEPRSVINEIADPRVKYIRTKENVGLPTARNIGWSRSKGKYIIFLDADDMLDRATLELLTDALERDTSIHIAYGRIDTVGEDGGGRRNNEWPQGDFDWRAQISHLNQMPYASMMRREVLERSGGYRARDWRAEDASMWIRLTSFGFRAKAVTDRPTLIYRFRQDSKSSQESREHADRDGDWTRWFPWRTGATNGRQGEDVFYSGTRPNPLQVPCGAQGAPPAPHPAWPVHHHAHPVVSIIIPVAASHRRYLIDALDSCIAQTIIDWEVIVIDDTPEASMPEVIKSHPFAKVFHSLGGGTSRARNIGIMHAKGQFLFFLDADDIIDPNTLEEMLSAYVQNEGYIYCDCKIPLDEKMLDGTSETVASADYNQELFIRSGYTNDMPGCHSVSILIAREDFNQTNGFDETMAYWEDWQLPLQLAALGIRGTRVSIPLLTYRFGTGIRRRASKTQEGLLQEALRVEFEPYTTGEKQMCACGGGSGGTGAKNAALKALSVLNQSPEHKTEDIQSLTRDGRVRLRYIGDRIAGVPYRGRVSRLQYVFGRDASSEFGDVDSRDAPELMRTGDFELVDTSRLFDQVQSQPMASSPVWNT